MRQVVPAVAITVVALVGSSACATKGFVRGRVGEVNDKVDTLSKTVEDTQNRTKENEGRISDVDQRAQKAAQDARTAAQAADAKAAEAGNRATEANNKVAEVEKATKRIVYQVVLSEDQGNFRFGRTDLPDTAKAEIDAVVQKLKTEPNGAYIEIEGHTDNVGAKIYNERLGLQRAEEVKRYMYEAHQIPLHRMNVISYGEDKPVAPNRNRAGRAQNRRVVIKVLV
jgi:outer membrane protein OmpA-like peptidoglycan-associated protein